MHLPKMRFYGSITSWIMLNGATDIWQPRNLEYYEAPDYIEPWPKRVAEFARLIMHTYKLDCMQPTYILQPLTSSAAAIAEIEVPSAGRLKVGREPTNDVALPHDLRMSSAHFELCTEAGGCRARDLGSTNGLFLNAKRVASALLVEGDELQAGESRWRVAIRNAPRDHKLSAVAANLSASVGTARPPRSYVSSRSADGLPGSAEQIEDGPPTDLRLTTDRNENRCFNASEIATIGRTDLADWVFANDGQMSSLHMEIFQYAGTWRVKDLDSSNGTYLNEVRISEGRLSPGDELRCGQTRFVVSLLPHQSSTAEGHQRPQRGPSGYSAKNSAVQVSAPRSSHRIAPSVDSPNVDPAPPAHSRSATAWVQRLSDGREFPLPRGQMIELGRGMHLAISLPEDLEVSTHHASLHFDGDYIHLHDKGSSNGTYVAGERITTCQLVNGQRFRVGKTDFLVLTACPDSNPAAASSPLTPATEADAGPRPGTAKPPLADKPELVSGCAAVPPMPTICSQANLIEDIASDSGVPEDTLPPASRHALQPREAAGSAPPDLSPAEPAGWELPPPALQLPADSQLQTAEPASSISPGQTINWDDSSTFAQRASEVQAVACRSGLVVYCGLSNSLDPVDVGLRVLQTTNGWVLNGGDIENWMEAAKQGLQGQPREWLSPAQADDASWMLPFLSTWGSGKAWLVFASVELDEVLQNILRLRPIAEDAPPLMPALTPVALASFLSESDPQAIARFFQPLDALLVEITAGQSWALFARPQLALKLQNL